MEKPDIRSLEVMPEEYKELYAEFMVPLLSIDSAVSPQKLAELEKLLIRIDLPDGLQKKILDYVFDTELPLDYASLIEKLNKLDFKSEKEEKAFKYAVVKDMMFIALSDGFLSGKEESILNEIASEFFGDQKEEILKSVQKAIKTEQDFLEGKIGISEYKKKMKDIASLITGLGVPVVAVYFAGSVVGLSAAGITSGLAALGLGGILGLSSMVTGIGIVILIGGITYKGVRLILGLNERKAKLKREELIQQVIKNNQKAIEKLTELYKQLSEELSELLERAENSRVEIESLRKKVSTYKRAFEYLSKNMNRIAG